MIYQKNFIKELSLTAVGILVMLLAVLVLTQAISLLGRATDRRVAVDAAAVLASFWAIGMTSFLLALTTFISMLTVLTRYWHGSEVPVWLSRGLALKQWVRPAMQFAVLLALLIVVMQLWMVPWAELRSRKYVEILKQKQEFSLVKAGELNSLGKHSNRVYFAETFDTESGIMKNLFLCKLDKNGNGNIIFAKEGNFVLADNKRTLELHNDYRYSDKPGRADYNQVSSKHLSMIINTTPKIVDPIAYHRIIPTAKLFGSDDPQYQAELM